jgi:hypothetical protein
MVARLHTLTGQRNVAIFFAFLTVIQLISANLEAQELVTERWPVPMKVDRADISTDMMLEFSFEPIDTPFPTYDPGQDADRIAMDEFVEALVSGNLEIALDRTAVPPGTTRENSRELLQVFNQMLSSSPDALEIERIVHIGPDRLLLWSLPLDNGNRFYRSFRFVRSDDSVLQYEGVASEPIASLITYALQVNQNEGPDPRDASEFDYDYIFPGTDERPVLFRFDGLEIDVDAFNPLGSTGNPAIDFFNQSMSILESGPPDEYAERFTAYSEARYSQWAIDQGAVAYEAYRSDMTQYGARVVFLLEADPLYLVFYLPTDPSVTGSPLRYAALYDNPDVGLELTNFYVVGLADSILQRREYFNEPFLRPLLVANSLIPSQIEAERALASASDTIMPNSDEILSDEDYIAFTNQGQEPKVIGGIEDIAGDDRAWLWYVGIGAILVITLIALGKKKTRG